MIYVGWAIVIGTAGIFIIGMLGADFLVPHQQKKAREAYKSRVQIAHELGMEIRHEKVNNGEGAIYEELGLYYCEVILGGRHYKRSGKSATEARKLLAEIKSKHSEDQSRADD